MIADYMIHASWCLDSNITFFSDKLHQFTCMWDGSGLLFFC